MSFRSLREFADVSLRWVQPNVVDRRDQRRAGDAILATLRWENLLGFLATGETAEGRWTLKRAGLLRPRVRVRLAGSDAGAALAALHWGRDAVIKLADGREFRWTCTSFWHSEGDFTTTGGEPLLVFRPRFAAAGSEAEIGLEAHALSLPKLALLALPGWHLMVLSHEETAAAAIP
jgi:hypothetical protein